MIKAPTTREPTGNLKIKREKIIIHITTISLHDKEPIFHSKYTIFFKQFQKNHTKSLRKKTWFHLVLIHVPFNSFSIWQLPMFHNFSSDLMTNSTRTRKWNLALYNMKIRVTNPTSYNQKRHILTPNTETKSTKITINKKSKGCLTADQKFHL